MPKRPSKTPGPAAEPASPEARRAAHLATELGPLLGHSFKHPEHLLRALTHPSYAHEGERQAPRPHYESLEFLGDAVLGLLVAELIFRRFPERSEGQMSKLRASLVSARSLAEMAEALRFESYLRLGRGERASGGPVKRSILADVMESVLGAIFLDGGIRAARAFVRRHFGPRIVESSTEPAAAWDSKTRLQEILQARGLPPPRYHVVREEGPPHRRFFEVEVELPGGESYRGEGWSKKQAQQASAKAALDGIGNRPAGKADPSGASA